MKLGFVSAILPDLPLAEVFHVAASLGYECVELMCWPAGKAERRYAGVTHVEVESLDSEAVERDSIAGRRVGGLDQRPGVLPQSSVTGSGGGGTCGGSYSQGD